MYVSLLGWQAHQVVGPPMASSCEEGRARAGMVYSHGAEEGCSPHLLDLGAGDKYLSEKLANSLN